MPLVTDQKICFGHEQEFGYSELLLYHNFNTFFSVAHVKENIHAQFLINGGRSYCDLDPEIDHIRFPEYATPEHLSAQSCVAAAIAGRIFTQQRLCTSPNDTLDMRSGLCNHGFVGSHENYSTKAFKESHFARAHPFFLTRHIITGIGGLNEDGEAVLSPRMDRINSLHYVSGFPHRSLLRVRENKNEETSSRVEVLCGDSNVLDTAFFLRIGMTALVMELIERECCPNIVYDRAYFKDDIRQTNSLSPKSWKLSGTPQRCSSPIEVQRRYCEEAANSLALTDEGREVVSMWSQVLDALESDDLNPLIGKIDWVTHLNSGKFGDRHNTYTVLLETHPPYAVVSEALVAKALHEPLDPTRAKARAEILKSLREDERYDPLSIQASWSQIVAYRGDVRVQFRFPDVLSDSYTVSTTSDPLRNPI